MKIISLEIENVKKIIALKISPDGNVIVIGGENEQGKTSVLDSIFMTLGGGDAITDEPLRRGAEKGHVFIDLGEIRVTRKFTKKGTSLVVTNADGDIKKSPQALLDSLTGELSFDPLQFKDMKPVKQLEILKGLVGLDFTGLDAKREREYSNRTDVNRDIKMLESQLEGIEQYPDAPKKIVSVSALTEELRNANENNNSIAEKKALVDKNNEEKLRAGDRADALEAQIEEIKKEISELALHKVTLQNRNTDIEEILAQTDETDTTAIEIRINDASEGNRQLEINELYEKKESEIKKLKNSSDEMTKAIDGIDHDKKVQMESADFPIEGLGFGDGMVMYQDLPFSEASTAGQLRVSVAMGIALNPTLKILLIDNGSCLDKKNLALMGEMAEKAGAEIWTTRVSDGDECQVIIEDGSVKNGG